MSDLNASNDSSDLNDLNDLNDLFSSPSSQDESMIDDLISLHMRIEKVTHELGQLQNELTDSKNQLIEKWSMAGITKITKHGFDVCMDPVDAWRINTGDIPLIIPLLEERGEEGIVKREPRIHHMSLQRVINQLLSDENSGYTAETLKESHPELNHYTGFSIYIKEEKKTKNNRRKK